MGVSCRDLMKVARHPAAAGLPGIWPKDDPPSGDGRMGVTYARLFNAAERVTQIARNNCPGENAVLVPVRFIPEWRALLAVPERCSEEPGVALITSPQGPAR